MKYAAHLAVLGLTLATGIARAATVSVAFSGTTYAALTPSGVVVASTPYSGVLTYNSSLAGTQDPNFAYIRNYTGALSSYSVTLGSSTYSGSAGTISVLNDSPNGVDALFFTLNAPNGPAYQGHAPTTFNLAFRDFTGTAFSSGALPLSFSLADFQPAPGNTGTAQTTFYFAVNNDPNGYQEYGTTSFATAAPVPLPAAAWLLLSGLSGVSLLGRRRQSASEG